MMSLPGMNLVANYAYQQIPELRMVIPFMRPHIHFKRRHGETSLVKSAAIDMQLFSINDTPLAEESKL